MKTLFLFFLLHTVVAVAQGDSSVPLLGILTKIPTPPTNIITAHRPVFEVFGDVEVAIRRLIQEEEQGMQSEQKQNPNTESTPSPTSGVRAKYVQEKTFTMDKEGSENNRAAVDTTPDIPTLARSFRSAYQQWSEQHGQQMSILRDSVDLLRDNLLKEFAADFDRLPELRAGQEPNEEYRKKNLNLMRIYAGRKTELANRMLVMYAHQYKQQYNTLLAFTMPFAMSMQMLDTNALERTTLLNTNTEVKEAYHTLVQLLVFWKDHAKILYAQAQEWYQQYAHRLQRINLQEILHRDELSGF